MTPAELFTESIRRSMLLVVQEGKDCKHPETYLIIFNPSDRNIRIISLEKNPDNILIELEEALENGWEPVAVQLCEGEKEEEIESLGIRFFTPEPSIEHQAVIDSLFEYDEEDEKGLTA
jgi:hypothetical protein